MVFICTIGRKLYSIYGSQHFVCGCLLVFVYVKIAYEIYFLSVRYRVVILLHCPFGRFVVFVLSV
ncbi:MAG TPA: hypothetical protein DEF33_00145 [Clostridiales bacterium]|nr:hypothetical protein [Clostridiales bacterium]